jgi:hypothetical protein
MTISLALETRRIILCVPIPFLEFTIAAHGTAYLSPTVCRMVAIRSPSVRRGQDRLSVYMAHGYRPPGAHKAIMPAILHYIH